ncbi:hypothetical protein DVDV_2651 [Desulfovibrio sp. DV]|nr:hypothetical protein DVDV_2651 [Desulfovibrio sp. DV]
MLHTENTHQTESHGDHDETGKTGTDFDPELPIFHAQYLLYRCYYGIKIVIRWERSKKPCNIFQHTADNTPTPLARTPNNVASEINILANFTQIYNSE